MSRTTKKEFRSTWQHDFHWVTYLAVIGLALLMGCARIDSPTSDASSTKTIPLIATSVPSTKTPMPIPSATQIPSPVEVIRDVPYVPDGNLLQELDIYLPTSGNGPFPTLFMIHEGNGRKEQLAVWGRTFAEKGYAAVSINHRQWPDYSYPSHLEDAFCALAWVIMNADTYPFDPHQIYVMGHSAGGTIAAMLAVVEDRAIFLESCPHQIPEGIRVQGAIPFTGIFDYTTAIVQSPLLEDYAVGMFGGGLDEIPEIWTQASANNWVDGSEPPFLIIHGAADSNIPPGQSIDFAEVLNSAGVQVELLLIPDASHTQITGSQEAMQAVEAFLTQYTNQ